MYNYNTGRRDKKEERKSRVLEHVVHAYVSTAVPVSSKTVAARMGGNISSATVRNIMGELEEEGYVEQPHTSAGRIPTHSGYRYYVDITKDHIRLRKKEAERLAREYNWRIRTIKEVIERTSFLISRELHNAGIVMWPSIEDFYLKHMELVKVRTETVLVILVTMTNAVKNYIVRLERDIEKAQLEKITNYINTNHEHSAFSRIAAELRSTLEDTSDSDRQDAAGIARSALAIIDSIIHEKMENEIYWEGLDYFMGEAEFQDVSITRRLLQMFSERDDLIRLMRKELPYRGIKVHIGEENSCKMLKECSVITSGYTLHGRTVGRIGVIGPTRMDYDHALRTVSCLSDLISLKLREIDW
ncbi:MAG: heat-inducible transcription repressor HrcA [Candidatus Makaraimicrobium thalassicum]|nr:MAG: heat-inducible transcription repressor HrcA [Candidatus Omnitrophota bacterium]